MNTQLIKKSILYRWETDKNLSKLINIFKNRSDLRFVGGCVRDVLLGHEINEIDFAINCKPQETIKILRENNPSGPATALFGNAVTPPIIGAICANSANGTNNGAMHVLVLLAPIMVPKVPNVFNLCNQLKKTRK